MECSAKTINSAPPAVATVFSLMRAASMRPPSTARPVHMEWPMTAPRVMPKGSCAAAMAIVAIWLRSPHSARKVSVKACWREGEWKEGENTKQITRREGDV